MPVSDLSYWRKGDAVHLSINKGLPWYIMQIACYLENVFIFLSDDIFKSVGTPGCEKDILIPKTYLDKKRYIYNNVYIRNNLYKKN